MTESGISIAIDWPCHSVVKSKKRETAVSQVLHRSGERGRGRDLPQHRLDEISQACNKHGMTLYQALGLRRSMLRTFPGGRLVNSMGNNSGQNRIASLFEDTVASFLRDATKGHSNVFLTEKEQRAEMQAGKRPRGLTPDFLFLKPVVINGQDVTWIDAKTYYGSAMFGNNKNIPNGKLQSIAQRYNSKFGGMGAFVFSQSFCSDLSRMVPGALLLDASPLDMTAYKAYQDAN